MAAKTLLLCEGDAILQFEAAVRRFLEEAKPLDSDVVHRVVDVYRALRTIGRAIVGNPRSGKEAIRRYLTMCTGKPVGSEYIDVISGIGDSGRRVREVRDHDGAPILCGSTVSKDEVAFAEASNFGRIPPDHYVLLPGAWFAGRQARIPTAVRLAVMARDGNSCRSCGWHPGCIDIQDRRRLEAHHVVRPEEGGTDEAGNLVTLCTTCHAGKHSRTEGRGRLLKAAADPSFKRAPSRKVPLADVLRDQGQASFLFL